MKNLFDPAAVTEIKIRLARLGPQSQRQWGSMTAAQMLAHCSAGLMMGTGELRPPRELVGRIIGRFIKPLALGNEAPFKRKTPTSEVLKVRDDRDFRVEQSHLAEMVDRFAAAGPGGVTKHPTRFSGR